MLSYKNNPVTKPGYEETAGNVSGRQYPAMTLLSIDLVPGSSGIVLPGRSNPNNPENPGAEIEFTMGEHLTFDRI